MCGSIAVMERGHDSVAFNGGIVVGARKMGHSISEVTTALYLTRAIGVRKL